jgi:large subunit ribosomal protein L32
MAQPKKRTSSARRDKRRANHDKITAPNLIPCPACGAPKLPHRMCGACGVYKGRTVMQIVTVEPEAPTEDESTPAA